MIYITPFLISIIILLTVIIGIGIHWIYKDKQKRKLPTAIEILENKAEKRIEKEKQQLAKEIERLSAIKTETPEQKLWVEIQTSTYETKLDKLKTEPETIEKYKTEPNKSGFVYIISNNKTFYRNNIFKIGMTRMTRRDDAQKRVKELSGASVPFPYHIVAVLFSDDVPTLETTLHKELSEYRLNKENRYKKEFFEIDKEKLIEVVKKYDITAQFNFEE